MAILQGVTPINSLFVAATDIDPTPGTATPIGSLVLARDGSGVFYKFGALATDYSKLATLVAGVVPVAQGGTGTSTTFTTGSVIFAGAAGVYSQDNANFFWDDANNRLGIGTTAPNHLLHVGSNAGVANRSIAFISGTINPTGFGAQLEVRDGTVNAAIGNNASTVFVAGTIARAASGTHPVFSTFRTFGCAITAGGAALSVSASYYIDGPPTGAVGTFNASMYINAGNLIVNAGNIGIGTGVPTARLHLAAGTAAASTAPLKFVSGTLLTTPEIGTMNFVTDDLYFTITTGTARQKLVRCLTGSATLDFPNTAAQTSSDLTISVIGAVLGDAVTVGRSGTIPANATITAFVSAADTVTVRYNNYSAVAQDPASATYNVTVIKNR
jgi:hypothetical protein